jgi:formylglycine-generating enzyme required for sulfatase activity
MGKFEVTNSQYTAFLNAVAASDPYQLYDSGMADEWGGIVRSGVPGRYTYAVKPPALNGSYAYENKPVIWVSWYDAARFANWLHNGQGSGDTETGAYTLLGGTPIPSNATSILRNAGARWWLPTQNEWHKAAYHKNDGATANYWEYPTGTNSVPDNNSPANDTGDSANFWDGNRFATGNSSYPLTEVGAYRLSASPYGTFDQGGNVDEWVDGLLDSSRAVRGGNWAIHEIPPHSHVGDLHALSVGFIDQGQGNPGTGFRVATIPEPATAWLGTPVFLALLWWRRRGL